jgi:hypothetical protein
MQKKKTNPDKKIANKRKVRKPSFNEVEEKRKMPRPSSIRVGNISKISGKLNIAGGNITTYDSTTGLRAAEIKQIFDPLYLAIESQKETSPAEKEDLEAEVKEIQAAVTEASQKDEKIDQGFLSRRFRNIARMAPDVLDVVVKTLANPTLGIAEVARKIAAKAKEEAKAA